MNHDAASWNNLVIVRMTPDSRDSKHHPNANTAQAHSLSLSDMGLSISRLLSSLSFTHETRRTSAGLEPPYISFAPARC